MENDEEANSVCVLCFIISATPQVRGGITTGLFSLGDALEKLERNFRYFQFFDQAKPRYAGLMNPTEVLTDKMAEANPKRWPPQIGVNVHI